MVKKHGLPLDLRELLQCCRQEQTVLPVFILSAVGSGGFLFSSVPSFERVKLWQNGDFAGITDIIPAEIHGNGQEIAFQIPVLVAVHVPDETEKGFLGQIIGILTASGLVAAEIVDVIVVFFGDHVQVLLLSVLDLPDQLPVLQKASHSFLLVLLGIPGKCRVGFQLFAVSGLRQIRRSYLI